MAIARPSLSPFAFVGSLALAACSTPGASDHNVPTDPAPSTAAVVPAPEQASRSIQRQACLAPPRGAPAQAREITAAQERINSLLLSRQAPLLKKPTVELPSATMASHWVSIGNGWVRKARGSTDPGFYFNAKSCAQLALHLQPKLAAAEHLLAAALLSDHKFAEVKALAQAIVQRDEDDQPAWGLLSDARLELGDMDGAMDAAQRMVDIKPNLPSYARAAHLMWLQGDSSAAKRTYQKAIAAGAEQQDKEPRAWVVCEAARVFYLEGDYAGADAGYKTALSWQAGYPPALVGRGRVAMAQGKWKTAADYFRRAYEQTPLIRTAGLWFTALVTSEQKAAVEGETNATLAAAENGAPPFQARTLLQRMLKDGPRQDPHALAAFLVRHGLRRAQALALAQDNYRSRPGQESLDIYAWALYRTGQTQQAVSLLQQSTAQRTPHPEFIFHRGAIALAGGDKQEGAALLRRAQDLSPRHHPVMNRELRGLIAGLEPPSVSTSALASELRAVGQGAEL